MEVKTTTTKNENVRLKVYGEINNTISPINKLHL